MSEDLEALVIKVVGEGQTFDSYAFASTHGIDHAKLVGTLKSLYGDGFVVLEQKETNFVELTEEAKGYADNGSPEIQLLKVIIAQNGMSVAEAKKYGIGLGKCMKNKWVEKDGDVWKSAVDVDTLADELQDQLKILEEKKGLPTALPEKDIKDLTKRKLLRPISIKHYFVQKGSNWAPKRKKQAAALTKEMIESGSWNEEQFKTMNIKSTGLRPPAGYLHPLLLVRAEYRKILIGMGFKEMPTNRWVENSFWNFDSLFQPQQHPARDAHDTFFIKEPSTASLETVPKEYLETVKRFHEQGGAGSIGYRYDWSLDEAKKNILRTHTTAVSSRMLYQLANQPGGFKPQKYFSIDRVFRNESLDATHLAEFHQIEGLVADRNLTLGDLMGVIKEFFAATGIHDIRFKPAFNPYTEPSMEIFGYHPDLKKWTEIGNSGMFRPEMLRPMGLPEDVRVIAWGFGLERPTMIKYRISKIKDLFGHRISLEGNQNGPLPRIG